MNEYAFVNTHGLEKSKRIIDNRFNNAEYYSEDSGSYYSYQTKTTVSLKSLKKAISDFEWVNNLKSKYEAELIKLNKEILK